MGPHFLLVVNKVVFLLFIKFGHLNFLTCDMSPKKGLSAKVPKQQTLCFGYLKLCIIEKEISWHKNFYLRLLVVVT